MLERDETTMVKRIPTTRFGSPAENTHVLPGTARDQDGRVLDLVASIGLLDASKAFAVFVRG